MVSGTEVLDCASIQTLLDSGDLRRLFIEELGWDHTRAELRINVEGAEVLLTGVAQKRSLVAFEYIAENGAAFPNYARRAAIELAVAKRVREHLIVFTNADRSRQIWQWTKREIGRPVQRREHAFTRGQRADLLVQKLSRLAFSLNAEAEGITIVDVAGRVRAAFDIDPITKRFYDGFQQEHETFLGEIHGISDKATRRWYASLMLNRLMFVYFIQKKGFLDGDALYLQSKLAASRATTKNRYLLDYLYPLFFECLAKPSDERAPALAKRIGRVPYLNGGLFKRHQIEIDYPDIKIADIAFEELLAFFDAYQWHLDDRPVEDQNKINPDVLGYIFERYVNQAEMGAYYTKEDVTEYMATSSIVPHILDKVSRSPDLAPCIENMWNMLRDDPNRYISRIAKHGCDEAIATVIPELDAVAPSSVALDAETWRELLRRRETYARLLENIKAGRIRSAGDALTHNLDVRQLVQDAIERSDDASFLDAIYGAVLNISIVDPSCGSGAFLFAAMKVLEPIYEACLDKMGVWVETGVLDEESVVSRFREIVATSTELHPNQEYFISKQIALRNLYGVDVMDEAVEICKLRLFLKLISRVDRVDDIEPLPDLDFNVRCGNALVGYATHSEVERSTRHQRPLTMEFDSQLESIDALAVRCAALFRRFRDDQMQPERAVETGDAKAELSTALEELTNELDRLLYEEKPRTRRFDKWRATARPFHWFAEFYFVIVAGGFDVVLGNPPFVDYDAALRGAYEISGFRTERSGNLYAMVVERSVQMLSERGQLGMIVPLSVTFSRNFVSLRQLLLEQKALLRFASFDNIPDRLFTGVKESTNTSKANQQRITIIALDRSATSRVLSTSLLRWKASERARLFADLSFADVSIEANSSAFPKIGDERLAAFSRCWNALPELLGQFMAASGKHRLVVPRTAGYYIAAYPSELDRSKQMTLSFSSAYHRDLAFILINSNVFFWRWRVLGDAFDVTSHIIESCPVPQLAETTVSELSKRLRAALKECSTEKMYRGVAVPNINFNKRLDLICNVDDALIHAIAPDLGLTSREFLWSKSNSCFVLDVPRSNLSGFQGERFCEN